MDIYSANFIFFSETKKGKKTIVREHLVENIVCKHIPIKFLINEKTAYLRALRSFSDSFLKELIVDKSTGLKKFKIILLLHF